jgi:hypothetical protein
MLKGVLQTKVVGIMVWKRVKMVSTETGGCRPALAGLRPAISSVSYRQLIVLRVESGELGRCEAAWLAGPAELERFGELERARGRSELACCAGRRCAGRELGLAEARVVCRARGRQLVLARWEPAMAWRLDAERAELVGRGLAGARRRGV